MGDTRPVKAETSHLRPLPSDAAEGWAHQMTFSPLHPIPPSCAKTDPHAPHNFQRYYIGPLTAPTNIARATAPPRADSLSTPVRHSSMGAVPLRKKSVQFDQASSQKPLLRETSSSGFTKVKDDMAVDSPASLRIGSGDTAPVPPEVVLPRPVQPSSLKEYPAYHGIESPDTDTSNKVRFNEQEVITRKSVLKKDRMLVKLGWTQSEDLPKDFDGLSARKYAIREEEWKEQIVVLRMGKLELWGETGFVNKALGHSDRLKLRQTISLSKGSTFLSIYSPVDRIFCLTYQPWKSLSAHHYKRGLYLRRQGTDIAFFDCRASTVASDWMWELWRELGGLIPEFLEVHMALADVTIRIPIPKEMPVDYVGPTGGDDDGVRPGRGNVALSPIGQTQEGSEGFKLVNRANIIAMAWRLVLEQPEWKDVLDSAKKKGIRAELAWRRGTELDWVINEKTVDDQPRDWAVLVGSLLKQFRQPSILEIRAASHYPTTVRLASGGMMEEPPAIEGYIWRVKPASGALTRLYITTHDGHFFICKPSRAFPPDHQLASQLQNTLRMRVRTPRREFSSHSSSSRFDAPGGKKLSTVKAFDRFMGREKSVRRDQNMAALRQEVLEAISYVATSEEEAEAQIKAYKAYEQRRQYEQIANSDGYIDLRTIYMIRAVGEGPVRCPGEDEGKPKGPRGGAAALRRVQEDQDAAQREGEESEPEENEEDLGGEQGLALAFDKAGMRHSRQVEIILVNGKVSRFEAYSKSVAKEWIERLGELAKYWRKREKADALDMLNASGFDVAQFHRKLQGKGPNGANSADISEEKVAPILGNLWHWCAIDACRGIIRTGQLFLKVSSYAPFKNRYFILIAGRMLCFKLVKGVLTARSCQNAGIFHRRQELIIHLRDAYVYSGKLCEDMLQNSRVEPAQAVSGLGGGGSNSGDRHRIPRVYADGLFSFDEDEDCTFVVRYRPESETTMLEGKTYKTIALRARSKLERDMWVRTISYEVEKLVRSDKERETRLKEIGKVDF